MKTRIEIQDARYTKTYATEDACVKAAEKLLEKYHASGAQHNSPRYIVSFSTALNRFYAVFVQTGADALYFANNKFIVCS